MKDGICIRELLPEDEQAVQKFFDTLGDESTSFFNVAHGNEKRTVGYLHGERPDHLFYAAVTPDGDIAGIVFIWDIDRLIPWLGICVNDNYQHMGIGSGLMSFISEKAQNAGGGGILLRTAKTNVKAQGLYEKFGFERLGEHPSGEYLYLYRIKKGCVLYG